MERGILTFFTIIILSLMIVMGTGREVREFVPRNKSIEYNLARERERIVERQQRVREWLRQKGYLEKH